ncbi:hypothetical protein SBP28_001308 [Candidozyma auris]
MLGSRGTELLVKANVSCSRVFHSISSCRVESTPPIYPHTSVPIPKDFDALAYRNWVQFRRTSPEAFSVMSYNLLSQHYVWKQVFEYLDPRFLDWPHYRFPLINRIIEQLPCDIMCFQELECSVYQHEWRKNFPVKNYESVYFRKPQPAYWGTRPPEFMDGVAIFINKDRFDLLKSHKVNFGHYVSTHTDRFQITEDMKSRLIPRNTVAVLVKLRDKLTKKILYVTNTHLYWSPAFNDVKLMQTKLLLNELSRFTEECDEENPCILMCGDFNSTPTSSVYKLLSRGIVRLSSEKDLADYYYGEKLDGESISNDVLHNQFSLVPAYGPLLDDSFSEKLDFTSYTKSLTAVLDHIWFSKSNLAATKVLGKVDESYSMNAAGFPDRQFPSDHIPLISEINYL